jgi:hypothetical protein
MHSALHCCLHCVLCRYDILAGLPGNTLTASETPGAKYNHPGTFGPHAQPVKRRSTQPRIGSAQRAASYKQAMGTKMASSTLHGRATPGPAVYSTTDGNGAVGRQVVSSARTQPTWGFGSGDRFAQAKPRARERAASARPARGASARGGVSGTVQQPGRFEVYARTPAPGAYKVQ